jgi:hypothetical protein
MAVSLKTTPQGMKLIDDARRARGWKKMEPEWVEFVQVAPATFKRFWSGQPIQREAFIALCEAVGIPWEEAADISASKDSSIAEEKINVLVKQMKDLYTRTAELEHSDDQGIEKLHSESLKSLCRGWLSELFELMVQATDSMYPDKTLFQRTQIVIHKIGFLFESLKEDLPGTFFKIKVSDEPGMLHEVTGEFKARHINISQIQITHDSEGMSELKIYCPSLKETVKGDLKRVLIELPGVASVTVSSL